MNTLSIPVGVMASISFYVGLYHLLIYFRRRSHREDLTFALLCLATGLYDVCCIGLYNTTTVAEGVQWQRMQFIALAFLTTAFLWFVFDYTRQKPGRAAYAISAYYVLAILIQLVNRSDLTWQVEQPAIKQFSLSPGLQITYYEATLGPLSALQGVVGMVASTYILWISARFYRRGYRREAVPLLLALGLMYAATANDMMMSNNVYQFVYVIEYAYLAMIILMAYSLSGAVVEAATVKEALRESEQRFQLFMQHFPGLAYIKDATPRVLFANQGFMDYLKIAPSAILGKTNRDVFPAEFADQITADDQHVLDSGVSETIEEHYGGRIWSTCKFPIPQADKPPLLGGFTLDITERKRMELETEERRLFLESILVAAPDAIVTSDAHHIIAEWNPGAEKLFGYSAAEAIGRRIDELITGNDPQILNEATRWTRHMQDTNASSIPPTETVRYRKDGSPVNVTVSVAPILVRNEWVGVVAIYTDITDRKRVELEREEMIAELEARNAELAQFAYTISHDLKAPLITIRGFLGFLEKDAASGNLDRLKADTARIIEATNKMQRLLHELLELSRIGRIMNPPQSVPFESIVREALELVRGRIQEHGAQVRVAPNLPLVYGDRTRLVEVVQNLVDNAAKFMGSQPEPLIEIGQRGADDQSRPILFVRDNGIGIEPQYHERVFGLFNKLDAQSEGTGVGLALVKRIIEFHGSRIWVESELGQGATFLFTLGTGG